MAKDKTQTKVKTVKKADADKSVAELRQDLLIAQKSLHDGTLTNPHAIKAIKKDIARKLTAENAAKLSASEEPQAKAKETNEKGAK